MSRGALGRMRGVYRKLPLSLRISVGRVIMGAIEPALAQRLPRAEPGPKRPSESACVFGLFRAPLGHGVAARLLMEELGAQGIACAAIDVSGALGASIESEAPGSALSPEACEAAILALNPDSCVFGLGAREAELMRGKRVIGYWVWELERAPRRWRQALRFVHDIWAPSAFAARAIESATGRRVDVAPHPAALRPPPARTGEERAAARARIGAGGDDFVALTSFAITSSIERKNPLGAMRAFVDAFAGRRDAKLVVRCVEGPRYPRALERLRRAAHEAGPQIVLIDAPRGAQELFDLYGAADAYVSLHRSEGFGLNLAEAMLAGLPVIATAWSGNLDFMDADCAAMVEPARLIPVRDPQRVYVAPGAHWAEPDHDAAVAHLRALAADAGLRARLSERGRRAAEERLAGGAAARYLRA